jgi:regulator of nucleoside diphosphate kinase
MPYTMAAPIGPIVTFNDPLSRKLKEQSMTTTSLSTHAPISFTDMPRLKELVHSSRYRSTDSKMLAQLRDQLDRRTVAPAADVPNDVVTMHSRVRILDLDTNRTEVFTLVFPEEASLFDHKMSVLAPVGAAILGARVGETLHVQVPAGTRRIKVVRLLYQPEAAGDFHL